MKKKLQSRRGETLTEVLVAILVTALAICLLAGMVQVSMSMNAQMREADAGENGFFPALSAAETHVFDHTQDDSLTIQTTGGPSAVQFAGVYLHEENGLVVYGKEG